MPNPTRRDMSQSVPLQNFTVAAMNEAEDFLLFKAAPPMDVDKQISKYYVYGTGDWNRVEMGPRGPSEESRGGSWSLSTATYNAKREAVHDDFDTSDASQTDDAISLDEDAADYLANQARMRGEQLLATHMAAATWTTDWDGAAARDYSSDEVLYWDNAAGDPQADHFHLRAAVKLLCGKYVNTMIVGANVEAALVGNTLFRASMQYVKEATGQALLDSLAAYFSVDQFLVGSAFYNSAAEGATDVLAHIIPADSVWCGYVNPAVGKKKMTALRTFAYTDGGRASNGVVTRQMDIETKTTIRSEIETFWDVKIVSADAGYFIDDVLT